MNTPKETRQFSLAWNGLLDPAVAFDVWWQTNLSAEWLPYGSVTNALVLPITTDTNLSGFFRVRARDLRSGEVSDWNQ